MGGGSRQLLCRVARGKSCVRDIPLTLTLSPEERGRIHESPLVMTGPLLVLALGAVGIGWIAAPWSGHFYQHFLGVEAHHPHGFPWMEVISVVVALPAAYALSKLKFWGREAVFGLVLFCLLIPVHAIALPLYIMLAKLGLTNSYAALVVPWTISVFGIFLMRQFFMTVPDDLIDAARMDGMSELAIVWRVMLPTAIPALMAFAIFSVVAHWNDYFWPRIVISGNRDLFTPPLGLREFKGDADGSFFGPMMATATVIVTPLIVAFLLAQKRFIEGITLSGMK